MLVADHREHPLEAFTRELGDATAADADQVLVPFLARYRFEAPKALTELVGAHEPAGEHAREARA